MNILLNNEQREYYTPEIDFLFKMCPETMGRKIKEANVQQGFILNSVQRVATKESKILSVGSYEDTAFEALKKAGYDVIGIDPLLNVSLKAFFLLTKEKFDIIFSTSVIEHVQDDELFIEQICQLLKPDGYAFLTCDFRNGYKAGDSKPDEDVKLYTEQDILGRIQNIIKNNGCYLSGSINYSGEPDFCYGVHWYNFATITFRKFA